MKIQAISMPPAGLLQRVAKSGQAFSFKVAPDGSVTYEPVEKANLAPWLLAPVAPAALTAYRYANIATPDQYISVFNQAGFTPSSAQAATHIVQNNITILKGSGLFVAVGAGSYLLIDKVAPRWELWMKLAFAGGLAAVTVALYALAVHYKIMK